MARYQFSKQIPSTFVDKDLLRQIETYFTERIPKKMLADVSGFDNEIKYEYVLIIHDEYGSEELHSVGDIYRDKFTNDVKRIDLRLSTGYRQIEIGLSFSLEIFGSNLNIDIHADNGKEVALGIRQEIDNLLKENRSIRFLFHAPYSWIALSVFFLALTKEFFLGKEEYFPYEDELIIFIIIFWLIFFLIKIISPYTTFDTKKQEKIYKFSKWIMNGMAGVFLFGVIALYLRNLLF